MNHKPIKKIDFEKHAKWLLPLIVITVLFFQININSKDRYEYNPMIMFFNSTGQIPKPGKIWMQTIPITTGNGQVVDISTAGFSSISTINITGINNTATVTSMPNCIVKSNTLTSLTFNTTVGNSAIVAILNGLVIPSNTTGMSASIVVIGN